MKEFFTIFSGLERMPGMFVNIVNARICNLQVNKIILQKTKDKRQKTKEDRPGSYKR